MVDNITTDLPPVSETFTTFFKSTFVKSVQRTAFGVLENLQSLVNGRFGVVVKQI
jgi:hypothetical protein